MKIDEILKVEYVTDSAFVTFKAGDMLYTVDVEEGDVIKGLELKTDGNKLYYGNGEYDYFSSFEKKPILS